MNLEIKTLSLIYQILSRELECKVFSNVPENAITPYVKIGDIEVRDWLLIPNSNIVRLTLSAFSELETSMQVIKIANKVKNILADSFNKTSKNFVMENSVILSSIFQLSNKTWVAEIQLEMHTIN